MGMLITLDGYLVLNQREGHLHIFFKHFHKQSEIYQIKSSFQQSKYLPQMIGQLPLQWTNKMLQNNIAYLKSNQKKWGSSSAFLFIG